ncbi:hypothetical protein [Ornithinimicrobium kibberense]|uniref:hypothetical protein n=1 Tax=Ornithinimicrobium kibberense TaxID=282060 RepID=UPI003605CC66
MVVRRDGGHRRVAVGRRRSGCGGGAAPPRPGRGSPGSVRRGVPAPMAGRGGPGDRAAVPVLRDGGTGLPAGPGLAGHTTTLASAGARHRGEPAGRHLLRAGGLTGPGPVRRRGPDQPRLRGARLRDLCTRGVEHRIPARARPQLAGRGQHRQPGAGRPGGAGAAG